MSPRVLVAMLALLVAIPLLSGCGAGETFSAEDVAKAADATVAKGGAKFAVESQMTLPRGAGPLTMSGQGTMNTRTQTGRLTLRATNAAGLPATVDKNDLAQEVVFDRFVFYLRSPVFEAGLKDGKKWVKIDLLEAGKAAGIDLASLASVGQDPTQALRLLKAVSGDIEKVGREDVRGVQTTHYKATIDLEKYPDIVPAKDRAAARSTIATLTKALGGSKSPVEFWIDEDDLVRRYVQSLRLKVGGATSSLRQRLEFYDYGTKADIAVPPADEVQDLTDIAAAGIGGSGATP